MTEPAPFDVCGPLPSGITLLEASAGTGKTFTIAALAARFVAEGVPLDRILLVTFGRLATGELRARVRERLVDVEAGFTAAARGVPLDPTDEVLTLLAGVDAADLARRRLRVAAALAEFDIATIATTHSFCHQVLSGIGIAGDVDRGAVLVDDVADLVDEVVDDLYLRRFFHEAPPPELPLTVARQIARAVVAQPGAAIVPIDAADPLAAVRARLAVAVRRGVERRKRELQILTYDDLLTRLERALREPDAAARVRHRFDVVMIDEFQDTDPVQWEIVRTAFADGTTTLVLIGDPKQAIYSFRGGDVHTYLDAAGHATSVATLARNWRSDQGLLDAYDVLFRGLTLGDAGIEYRTVAAAPANRTPRLRGAPGPAPLRVRIAHRDDGRLDRTPQGWAAAVSSRREVAADLAADVVALLASGAERIARTADGAETVCDVGPGDIGVLVATNRQGALVRDALAAIGVPAVIGGAGSVFGTPMAREWLALLEALERPAATSRVRTAALSSFIGWSVERVATASEDEWEEVYVRVHEWAAVLRASGVAALLETISRREGLPARVLGRVDGEREITDLRHIGQLLHEAATSERLGVTALTAWLRTNVREAAEDVADEDRSRRLESDAAAVQVLTIHRCKGLQFPIVYCPFLWQPPWSPPEELPLFHDPDAGGRRSIDVGGTTGPGFDVHRELHDRERQGEALRLAYVALTRACHQTVLHWASTWDSRQSPLARILFAADLGPDGIGLDVAPDEDEVIARLRELAEQAPGTISVERTSGPADQRWHASAAPGSATLEVRVFDRTFDQTWGRSSYSGLTSAAAAKEHVVASEPDLAGTVDEDVDLAGSSAGDPEDPERSRLESITLPLGVMSGGARVGTVVHAVLEHTDFTAPDLDAALRVALADAGGSTSIGPVDEVIAGLGQAIATPLGPLAGDRRLLDIATADRLDELTFELPVAGGDAAGRTLRRRRARRPVPGAPARR